MTTKFEEPLTLNEFKSVDGNVLPDTSGNEWRTSGTKSIEDILNMGCIKLFKIRPQDS